MRGAAPAASSLLTHHLAHQDWATEPFLPLRKYRLLIELDVSAEAVLHAMQRDGVSPQSIEVFFGRFKPPPRPPTARPSRPSSSSSPPSSSLPPTDWLLSPSSPFPQILSRVDAASDPSQLMLAWDHLDALLDYCSMRSTPNDNAKHHTRQVVVATAHAAKCRHTPPIWNSDVAIAFRNALTHFV